jgi:hypothetical protein
MANAPGGWPQGNGQPPQVFYVQQPMPAASQYPPQPGLSVERVTVPLILFVSASAFIGWVSWFGTTSINSIQSEIKGISVSLNNYIDQQNERTARIEDAIEKRTSERWTKTDQQLFCARTESIPGNKGWKCGETENGFAKVDRPSLFDSLLENASPVADVGPERPIGRWSNPKVKATP